MKTALMRWGSILLGGLLLSLSFPNTLLPGRYGDHPPFLLGWLALIPLLWAVLSFPPRTAIYAGWVYAFVFYLGTLSWIRLFGLLPWLLLALVISLTAPIAVWATQRMQLPRWMTPAAFALAWTGVEWARSQSSFGLSWAEIGTSQIDGFPAVMASLGSVYLISFLMLTVIGTLLLTVQRRPDTPRWLLSVTLLVLTGCLLAGWGQVYRQHTRWQHQTRSERFAIVQPNLLRGLTPEALVTPLTPDQLFQREQTTITLSRRSVQKWQGETPVIVWPESAISYPPYTPGIRGLCQSVHAYLLVGAIAYPPPDYLPRNAAFLLDPTGIERDRYDKIHLVPFGEFVPFRSLVARFYTVRSNDIQPGKSWHPLKTDGHRLGVGICFESTVSAIARTYAKRGAHYLIYITNDAWFHRTAAVRQHFNHARVRALETGLPVVRAASTGISGFIAPDGSILDEIPNYTTGTRTRRLAEGTPNTVFCSFGWLFAPFCLAASLVLVLRGIIMARRYSSPNRT